MFFTTKAFLKDLVERTVSTIAQTAAGLLVADTFTPLDVGSWQTVAVASGVAGLIAALKALSVRTDASPTLRQAVTERGEFE